MQKRVKLIEGLGDPAVVAQVKAKIPPARPSWSCSTPITATTRSGNSQLRTVGDRKLLSRGRDTILGRRPEQPLRARSKILLKETNRSARCSLSQEGTRMFDPDPVINGKLIFQFPGGYFAVPSGIRVCHCRRAIDVHAHTLDLAAAALQGTGNRGRDRAKLPRSWLARIVGAAIGTPKSAIPDNARGADCGPSARSSAH